MTCNSLQGIFTTMIGFVTWPPLYIYKATFTLSHSHFHTWTRYISIAVYCLDCHVPVYVGKDESKVEKVRSILSQLEYKYEINL